MKQNKFLWLGVLGLTLGVSSCMDDSYDLDDIDMTLGVNTDLTLPSCSTDSVYLKSILDLKEDGVVKLVENPKVPGDSMYVVTQTGNPDIDPIKIDEIKIAKPTINPINATVKLFDELPLSQKASKRAPGRRNIKVNVKGFEIDLEDTAYTYTITEDDNTRQTLSGAKATGISTDVVDIERIKFGKTKITLQINTDFPDHFPYMHLDNLTLTLPEDIHIKSCKLNEKDAMKIEPGKITITGEKGSEYDQQLSTRNIKLEMVFDEASTGNDFVFDGNKHEASLGGDFEVKGTFRVETSEIKADKIVSIIESQWENLALKAMMGKLAISDINGIIPTEINFRGETWFDKDILLTHVTGKFQHEIGDIDPISLSDLPDFLEDNDVVLDLANPMVFLSVRNSLSADIITALSLTSDTDESGAHGTGPLTIGANATNKYYLAEKEETDFLPADKADYKFVKVDGLPNLIKKIPDEIKVDVDKVKLVATDLDITKEYPIDIEYEVYAPLIFGEDFKLVYAGTEDGFDLGDDLEDLDAESLHIKANVISDVPADIRLDVELLDINGQKIDIVEDNSVIIKKTSGANKVSAIELNIKPKEGYSLKDILSGSKQLDGIKYRAVLDKPNTGEPLRNKTSLIIKDIKVSIKGVVTYDAN